MNKIKRITAILLCLVLTILVVPAKDVEASSRVKKKGYYETCLSKVANPLIDPEGNVYAYDRYIKKVKLKGNTLTTYGDFYYASKSENLLSYRNVKVLKCKKRTFKLSSKCKFYAGGGGSPRSISDLKVKRISKAKAKSYLKKYNGDDIFIKVKNGKVTEIIFASMCKA